MLIAGRIAMTTQQEEATQIFDEVVRDLSNPSHNLKSAMLRSLHACTLLGWTEQREWFRQEISGYSDETVLPQYRIAKGTKRYYIDSSNATLVRALGGPKRVASIESKTIPDEGHFRDGIDN